MSYLATPALALRLLVAMVCLVAVIGKMAGRGGLRAFGDSLAGVGVPRRLVVPVGAAVLGAEVVVAGLAPWPATGLAGCVVGVVLFTVLTAGLAAAVRRGTTAACRCFGVRGGRIGRFHVARNAALTGIAVAASVTTLLAPASAPHPATTVLAIGTAAVSALTFVYWDDIVNVVFDTPETPDHEIATQSRR